MTRNLCLLFLFILIKPLLGQSQPIRLEYDFSKSDHGFEAQFAGIYVDDPPEAYDVKSSWQPLPEILGGKHALFISGIASSYGFWKGWRKKIEGLQPNTEYALTLDIELASEVGFGISMINGGRGESERIKAGAVSIEPVVEQVYIENLGTRFELNIDKGDNPRVGGDLKILGNIATPLFQTIHWVLINRHSHGNPQMVTTSEEGSLWLVVGTESFVTAKTELYYTSIKVWLNKVGSPYVWAEHDFNDEPVLVYNEGSLSSSSDMINWEPTEPIERPVPAIEDVNTATFWRLSLP